MTIEVPMMDEDAQRLYLNVLISNPGVFARVNHLLSPTLFDAPLSKGVRFLQTYFDENKAVPATSIFTAATKLQVQPEILNATDQTYLLNQIASFCRFRAVIEQVQKAVGQNGYLEKGDLGGMMAGLQAAVQMGLMTDVGINYFENVEERLASYDDVDPVISTGWADVDALIGGGICRQELVLFLAPSGGGKSVGMLNLARNFMEQGLSGVYISLEMKDRRVSQRTDQLLARMASGMISLNQTQVAHEIHKFHERTGAKFFIKRMRETTTSSRDIAAYLHELKVKHQFTPDFIVGDYIDIMASIQRGYGDNMFLKDKFVSEEFRALGIDYNAIMVSGSQLGKHATDAINDGKVLHQGDVQGGSSKTNTADLMITIERTEAMKQANECRFGFPKARNADTADHRVPMKWNTKTLLISDGSKTELELVKRDKGSPLPAPRRGAGLGDLLRRTEPEQDAPGQA